MIAYKKAKQRNPNYNTLDFRVEQYGTIFLTSLKYLGYLNKEIK